MTTQRTTAVSPAVKETRGIQTCALKYTISVVKHNFPVNSKYVKKTLIYNPSVVTISVSNRLRKHSLTQV